MKRKHLKKKEIRSLEEQVKERYGIDIDLPKKGGVEQLSGKDAEIIAVNGKPWFFLHGNIPLPTLHFLLEKQFLKTIVIDMPAIPYITNGADVMRPGIVSIDDGFSTGDAVCIVDETHHKPLAVGLSLFSSDEMKAKDSGKVIDNIHYIGDTIWTIAS